MIDSQLELHTPLEAVKSNHCTSLSCIAFLQEKPMKKTLVIGASENTNRYSNMAIHRLNNFGHPVVAVGKKKGQAYGVEIQTDKPAISDLDTITLYVNPINQKQLYSYIISLKPKRIIFNPGTENDELKTLATSNGIEVLEACTLVMLNTNQY